MADTQPTASSTEPAQSSAAASKSGVSSGATAGIAIGTFVVGLLVGGALLYLLWARKRRNTGNVPSTEKPHTGAAGVVPRAGDRGAVAGGAGAGTGATTGAGVGGKTQTIAADSPAAVVENNLPDPLADDTIISEFTKLDDRIHGHVRSYYNSDSSSDHNVADLTRTFFTSLGPTTGSAQAVSLPGAAEVAELLYSQQTRHAALRHALARVLVGRIDVDAGVVGDGSLLPAGVAEAARAVHASAAEGGNDTHTAFLTRWHAITHHLLPSHEPTALAGFAAVQQADVLLAPYATPGQSERSQNLEAITQRAARLGDLLFGQPALWRLDWTHTAGAGVVVFPALVKLTDDKGRRLREPRVFVEKKVVGV